MKKQKKCFYILTLTLVSVFITPLIEADTSKRVEKLQKTIENLIYADTIAISSTYVDYKQRLVEENWYLKRIEGEENRHNMRVERLLLADGANETSDDVFCRCLGLIL